MFFVLMQFIVFPERKDAILKNSKDILHVDASGSLGMKKNGKCIKSFPNQTLVGDKMSDWCSNIAKSPNNKPWISYSLQGKGMRVSGYSVRSGCCAYLCCCIDDATDIDYCCCELYSFSLQGSNDNRTWKIIHKVEKEKEFWNCKTMTYNFDMTESFRYIRFVQDEKKPYCSFCMALNQFELYGEIVSNDGINYAIGDDDNEESVSIIGKINKEE